MDERCAAAHAKLIAGTCPWCGRAIINERAVGVQVLAYFETYQLRVSLSPVAREISLTWIVEHEGPLELDRAVRCIEEVARQLVEIHQHQPFHGNVHPSSIFLFADGAHLRQSMPSFEESDIDTEGILGLADCLAPEQALNSSRADGRADIYSLGCTLYFLLAGRPPFPDGSISERLLQHQTSTPEPLGSLRPDVPAALVQICEKMMAKKPADRYETAIELLQSLTTCRNK